LKDQLTGNYDLQPLQNNILDYWSANWSRLGKNNSPLILQANKNYSSVAKFLGDLKSGSLKNCPSGPLTCVAVYNYPLKLNYSLPSSTILSPLVITQPLRGAHQFYLYLQNKKPWRLSINFTYLRLDPKPDPVTVNIWFGNKIIMSQSIPDNNLSSSALKTKNQGLIFKGFAPVAGVYKVEIKINQDVVIKSIESSSNKLVAIHKIWPVSGSGGLTLFTNANHLRVQTSNPASLGKIIFGNKIFNLAKTYRPFHWFSPEKLPIIKIKKDDIILANNGVLAFSKSSLFNPDLKKVDRYFSPGDDTKYIIANYQAPLENKGLKIAKAKFNLSDAYRFAGRYTFVISIPGLAGRKGSKNYLEIKEIILNLSGKTLWQKIWP